MTVRTRLILAFLGLSVLPLSAVTFYSYVSSVAAFRSAVESEAEQTAADLQVRLDTLTADLGTRVGRLWEPVAATAPATDAVASAEFEVMEQVAAMLGDSARLVDRVEFMGLDGAPVPPAPPAPPAPARRAGPAPTAPPPSAAGASPGRLVIDMRSALSSIEQDLTAEGVPPEAAAKLRELAEQFAPTLQKGVQAGVRMAGSATRSALAAASDDVRERAHARAMRARQAAASARQTKLAGDALAVPVVRDGRLVGSVSAQLNLSRTLATVLGTTRVSQGEIPFAVDADGAVYTADPAQAPQLTTLRVAALTTDGVHQAGDWVVVTRRTPSDITVGIARPIALSLREIRGASVRSLSLGLGVIAVALVGIVPLSRRMTRNLTTLTDGVQRIARGDFSARVPVRSKDEFGALADAFNHMARDVQQHQRLVVERESLRRELALCRRIQTEMLPHTSLRLGATEVRGISIPAREVGGDFFNYFELPGGHVAVLVGDVSGKGMSAALLMANIQATLRARLPLEADLAKLTTAIDAEIEAATPAGVYATLFLGILDPVGKTLRYVNAGHHPQFLIRGDGIEPLSTGGMPVGLYAGHGYTERAVQLADDDLLFFYTDGLVEVENESGEMFGAERLEALLRAHSATGVDTLLERAEDGVRRFRGAAEPFDDVTIMALRLGERPRVI